MDNAELLKRCLRVFHISRKPTGSEYSEVARVAALGLFILGFVGFVISIIFNLIR